MSWLEREDEVNRSNWVVINKQVELLVQRDDLTRQTQQIKRVNSKTKKEYLKSQNTLVFDNSKRRFKKGSNVRAKFGVKQ